MPLSRIETIGEDADGEEWRRDGASGRGASVEVV